MTDEERFWSRVDKSAGAEGCWLWTRGCFDDGVGQFRLQGHASPVRAPRYAWELSRGAILPSLTVIQRCRQRRCVNPAHLVLGTRSDAVNHAVAGGGHTVGERNGRCRLSPAWVRQIREQQARGEPIVAIVRAFAQQLQVNPATIYDVLAGRNWRHV